MKIIDQKELEAPSDGEKTDMTRRFSFLTRYKMVADWFERGTKGDSDKKWNAFEWGRGEWGRWRDVAGKWAERWDSQVKRRALESGDN